MKKLLFTDIINEKLPFVIYKNPGEKTLYVIQQQTDRMYFDKSLKQKGFFFAPYDFNKHQVILFPLEHAILNSYSLSDFDVEYAPVSLQSIEKSSEEEHCKKVGEAIELIRNGVLKKMIVSRKQKISFSGFDVYAALIRLMTEYDCSFVYLWHHPEVGNWLGATPEILMESTERFIRTVALAGTILLENHQKPVWQQKEIDEQQIVTDYILSKLQAYTPNITTKGPENVFQGKIVHLKTEISAAIQTGQPEEIILKLHPTPAVCGVPVEKAKEFIDKIERYDRKYYTGFLGLKTKRKTKFFVNLRCMEIFDNHIDIYVGGGITRDSDPQKEWEETQDKAKILISGLL